MAAALVHPPLDYDPADKLKFEYATPSSRLWPTNYSKFSVNTMFTLFFGGEIWCPNTVTPSGENVGKVLRQAWINAYSYLASRLKDLDCIIGYDVMNEPWPGYIGLDSLDEFDQTTNLHLGPMPSGVQGMALAGGYTVEDVPYFTRSWPQPSKHTHDVIVNSDRVNSWTRKDIWRELGVYEVDEDTGRIKYGPKGKHYFKFHPVTGQPVSFEADFYVPFVREFQKAIHVALKGGKSGNWIFVEPIPNLPPPTMTTDDKFLESSEVVETEKLVYCPHWYDIRVIFEKVLLFRSTYFLLR